MVKNDFNVVIDLDEIESKEQFLTFIDIVLAHGFVKEYDDCGIVSYLHKKEKTSQRETNGNTKTTKI